MLCGNGADGGLPFDASLEVLRASTRGGGRAEKLRERLDTAKLGRRTAQAIESSAGRKAGHGKELLAHALTEALNDILSNELVDVRGITEGLEPIVVTRCSVAKDRRSAVVYWLLPSRDMEWARFKKGSKFRLPSDVSAGTSRVPRSGLEDRIAAALERKSGKIRRELFLQGELKVVPRLLWRRDEGRLKQMRMAAAVEGMAKDE